MKDVPIPTVRTKEQDAGLWGGEEVVKGYTHPHFNRPYVPRYWVPKLQKRVFFSEILNRWFTITCTERTLHQVDDCGGFDEYILATHEVDLKSRLGMRLKREMLLALANKTGALADKAKRDGLLEKYKRHIIPVSLGRIFGPAFGLWHFLSLEHSLSRRSVSRLLFLLNRRKRLNGLVSIWSKQPRSNLPWKTKPSRRASSR